MRVLAWCLPALALVSGGCDRDDVDYAVGTIERHRIELVADSAEPVVALRVQEGDRVTPGMPLLEQDATKLELVLERARAEEELSLAALREAEKGPRAQEIEQARAQLAASKSALATTEHELHRHESLVARNYSSQSQVNILKGQVDEAQARVAEVRARLDELLEGTRSERVDQARAAYAASRAQVQDLELDVSRAVIRAPVAGVVESLPFRPGERPLRGQTVLALLSDERTFARVHIPEPLRVRVSSGDPALLRVDGVDTELEGRVRWISSEAAFTPYYALTQRDRSRLAYLAEVDVVGNVTLPNGIPVEVRFPAAVQP